MWRQWWFLLITLSNFLFTLFGCYCIFIQALMNIVLFVYVSFFRWVENKKALDRLIEVWGNVKKTVAFREGLPKSKRPSSKSFLAVKDSVGDPLFIAKLWFFSFVSNIVEPFLKNTRLTNRWFHSYIVTRKILLSSYWT